MLIYLLSSLIKIVFADLFVCPVSPSDLRELELAPLLLSTGCFALEELPTELF